MSQPIFRVTLFKIPREEDQQKVLDIYNSMPPKVIKHGKPYVRLVTVGRPKPDQRAQGFTVAAVSRFDNSDDMAYYDNECPCHAELKSFAKSVHEGLVMVYFDNELLSI
ncbi:hypothetical protein CEP51_015839 [Fusarium floridanum]|uniref:Stress-response A/B barrel domain-containing protein n=1 Tax=Fusarium floridanum TaxID=1325733 RepID=A0A428P1W4_9HYPO|nr:hypothetical protein CEP51_015839 [Fusarium floridanum]